MFSIDQPRFSELLLTDLYEFTMLQAYAEAGMGEVAVFEFFVRKLPETRGFLVAAGLEQVVDFLETARFTEQDLEILRNEAKFSAGFVDRLAEFRFTGDVHAMPEGTVFFPDEPILRITAPIAEAQIVETRIINLLHFQTVIASKAARMVLAAEGRPLVDFGLRRAHGAEAGMLAARASYLSGFAGTATTPASARFGIPVFGTMAHSFIQAHDAEQEAFLNFAKARPQAVVLLIDTYDTERGARKVVELAPRLRDLGIPISGVRIDSGDLASHAVKVRRILDDGGLSEVRIIASGGIDETKLKAFAAAGAPIDSCGIGTSLTTAQDAPALDCAYKLQEYDGKPKRKRSEGKATWPGRKQVFRSTGKAGVMTSDILGLEGETNAGQPLIEPVMQAGQRISPPPTLDEARQRTAGQ
ncbi:MAG: nicotinate phosphoribosyltransferase, partial [Hyphomicrobiales bacterium]